MFATIRGDNQIGSFAIPTGIKTVPDPLKASTFTWKGMVNVGQRHGEWKRVADGPVGVVKRDVFGEHSGKRERIVEREKWRPVFSLACASVFTGLGKTTAFGGV